MPTKRFVWKDRDSAAVDLIQLAYHAPQHLSQQALHILSAICSNVIVTDLQAITLDVERTYWERVYALRALPSAPGDIRFTELISIVDSDLLNHQQIISRSGHDIETLHELYFPNDMLGEIIAFAAKHSSNRSWLFERFDQVDPVVVCILFFKQLDVHMPHDMAILVLHHLIDLLDADPTLLNLYSIHQIYAYRDSDDKTFLFLKKNFDAIVERSLNAIPPHYSRTEIPWTIPLEWSELKTELFQRRPELIEKYRRDETRLASEQRKHQEISRIDLSYKETAIWRELESLNEQARGGDLQAGLKLYRKSFDSSLSIPRRAAATYFFGKLQDRTDTIEKLALLVRRTGDNWERDFSPVQFEAGKALFEAATPSAWEALVGGFFANPPNMLENFLWDWIQNLTDKLSGVGTMYEGVEQGIENRWFKALIEET